VLRYKCSKSAKIEIARLSTLAITQTSIIIKYSLVFLYEIMMMQVTKKIVQTKMPEQLLLPFKFNDKI